MPILQLEKIGIGVCAGKGMLDVNRDLAHHSLIADQLSYGNVFIRRIRHGMDYLKATI